MSFPLPFNSNESSQPQVRLETFEDLSTVRRAVGEVRGFEDPITAELVDDTRSSFGKGSNEFQPKVYEGDEARIIVHSLKKIAKSREDDLALSAADALQRMPPLRLRTGMFVAELFKKNQVPSSTAPKPVSDGLFDPSFSGTRPPIVWESKYDSSRKGKKF